MDAQFANVEAPFAKVFTQFAQMNAQEGDRAQGFRCADGWRNWPVVR